MLGWRTVCAVEWEAYPASILCARQNDGLLPSFPIWDDVQTFDGKPWQGIVDVVSGGFPCQDISVTGKGAGIEGERSGMWKQMARIIGEVRPKFVFVENSPMLTIRGLGTVLADLSKMGFDAEWGVMGAADVGANHKRDRIWIVAKISNTDSLGWKKRNSSKLEANKTIRPYSTIPFKSGIERFDRDSWKTEPSICRVVNGMAAGVDRLAALGNGQVPLCAATAFELLRKRLDE